MDINSNLEFVSNIQLFDQTTEKFLKLDFDNMRHQRTKKKLNSSEKYNTKFVGIVPRYCSKLKKKKNRDYDLPI